MRGYFPGSVIAPLFSHTSKNGKFSEQNLQLRDIHVIQGNSSKTIQTVHLLGPGYLDVDKISGAEILQDMIILIH